MNSFDRFNKIRKNYFHFLKTAAGVPRPAIFLDKNDVEDRSSRTIDEISTIAANSAAIKLVNRNTYDEQILGKAFKIKKFNNESIWVVISINITFNPRLVATDTSLIDSSLLGNAAQLIPSDKVALIRLNLYAEDLYNPSIDYFPNISFIKIYIKEKLAHELVHAAQNLLTSSDVELSPQDLVDYSERNKKERKIKFNELLHIFDEDNPLSSFYYTTREEVAAYLRQIVLELEHNLTEDDFERLSFDKILRHSNTLPVLLKALEEGEEIKTPFGKLNKRKENTRRKILSALYSWIMNKKESLKSNNKTKLSRANKIKLFFKIASEDILG